MLGSFKRKSNPEQHFGLNLPPVEKDQHSEIAHPNPNSSEGDIVIPPPKRYLLTAENIALLSILLLLLVAGFGLWSWMRLGSLEKIRQSESKQHELVLDSLSQLKISLENNLNLLEGAFAELRAGKDTLAERLAAATNIIAEKETVIREIKSQNVREERALRAQIQRLQTMKDRYETLIAILDQKNAALSAENARLRGTTDSLSNQVSELGRQLEAQIRRTLSAQYKATAFRVEVERRNDKLTVRAKRTRALTVSFELNNVPSAYQGNQQLYLTVTDDKGLPIASKNPTQAMIKTEKGNVAIIAQVTQFQNVIGDQRVLLNYKLEDRLKKGTYIASVYSDKGLLGVASFRLN